MRNAIKNFDSTYDYRLYEYLTENRATDFQGSEKSLALLKSIDDYISLKRENNLYSQDKKQQKFNKNICILVHYFCYNQLGVISKCILFK